MRLIGRRIGENGVKRISSTNIIARLTSPIGITPSFSPSIGSANKLNASLISASSWAVMLFSLASFDWRGPAALDEEEAFAALRFAGGCIVLQSRDEVSALARDYYVRERTG